MNSGSRDVSPKKIEMPLFGSVPARTPIYPAAVYHCDSPEHATQLLGDDPRGYAYQRDGNPNADVLAEKCRLLHDAERAIVTSSGQAAMSAVLLSQLRPGDHVLCSNRLYGGSSTLIDGEASRFGIESTEVDSCDLEEVKKSIRAETQLIVVETISNPTLRVANIAALADLAHENQALLLVDNTFATPVVCCPLALGADFVLESLTKFMNGHGDVMLGALLGSEDCWERVPKVVSKWGLAASPFDCWLAERGLETLHIRMEAAAASAMKISQELLARSSMLQRIDYPGLPSHLDFQLAQKQFLQNCRAEPHFANMITLHLDGGVAAATAFIKASRQIPYCPSLGETVTTLSHPASSSHRNLSETNWGR